ncbi:hypothetical protein AB1285_21270 [Microbacterium sp. NRRL B-14842]|uniref:hypothetical protein n=1 Tax=Microbacterium sp. NRRL B-14842 TaxID=3162881 RepID=UPI003D2E050B
MRSSSRDEESVWSMRSSTPPQSVLAMPLVRPRSIVRSTSGSATYSPVSSGRSIARTTTAQSEDCRTAPARDSSAIAMSRSSSGGGSRRSSSPVTSTFSTVTCG